VPRVRVVESSDPNGRPNLAQRCKRFATASSSTQVAVLTWRYDTEMGTANSLHASPWYDEYNERFGLKKSGPLDASLHSCRLMRMKLAKIGATLPFAKVPSLLAPVIVKIRHSRYSTWRRNHFHKSLCCYQILSVSTEELALSCLVRCELTRLYCQATAFFCPLINAG